MLTETKNNEAYQSPILEKFKCFLVIQNFESDWIRKTNTAGTCTGSS